MEIVTRIKENWLTRKPNPAATDATMTMGLLLFTAGFVFLMNLFNAGQWMPASGEAVFVKHEYWRLWTALFAHADLEHLLSNAVLFFPFAYFLSSYFGVLFVPILGLFFGGLTNFLVLKDMLPQTSLIGISGVVYWLGSSWLTLYLLIDRRDSMRRRVAKVVIISSVLFAPQAYKPEVSYMSHALGYLLGVLSSALYYWFNRQRFLNAEVMEHIIEE